MDKVVFKKSNLVVAMALATSVILVGCDESTETINHGANANAASRIEVEHVTSKTDVFGVVQDTNGNAIKGATISIGGSFTTTTDATGAYHLKDVPVTGFSNGVSVNDSGDQIIESGGTAKALQISIKTPDQYLDATVSVVPVAGQNMVSSTGFDGSAGGSLAASNSLMAIILSEGIAVAAGIAVVPELKAKVTGVLRDQTTGLVIADTVVGLELVGVAGVAQKQVHNSEPGTGYSAMPYMVTTDAEGKFSFTNIPEDAEFDIVVEGWNASDIGFEGNGELGDFNRSNVDFSTTPEVVSQNIGDLMVTPMYSNDNIEPFVTRVDGVVLNGSRAVLNDDLDGTQGIVIHFNEPMADLVDTNSIFVVDVTTEGDTKIITINDPVMSADGLTLTISTILPLAEGTLFNIYMQQADFEDGSENTLGEGDSGDYLGKRLPGYDYIPPIDGAFVGLKLQTHQDPIVGTSAVSDLVQVFTDPVDDSDFALLEDINANFVSDDHQTAGTVSQLNGTDSTRFC